MREHWKTITILMIIALVTIGILLRDPVKRQIFEPTDTNIEQGVSIQEGAPEMAVIAEDLDIPWETVFLPNGDILVTQRSGSIVRISDGRTFIVDGVQHSGEGGLLGLALHPDFSINQQLYIYLTSVSGNDLINRVERYTLVNDALADRVEILSDIPGARNHDGGRLAFGPEGMLYITTGDAGKPENSQNTDSLAGKILRLTDQGTIPPDNPFGNPIYSYGHRNPQGLAWDASGRLWSTEHGPSGLNSGYDELNLIEKGANYGWPEIQGDETREGMVAPVVQSGSDETWAPAGLAYSGGSLFFGGLRGESLYQAKINDEDVSLINHLRGDLGRIRAVVVGSGDDLYITTSNTDGRGDTRDGDDKLIRLSADIFDN